MFFEDRKIEIYTEYRCRKGHHWAKTWRKYPWCDDFSMACKKCGQVKWPSYKYDASNPQLIAERQTWWR